MAKRDELTIEQFDYALKLSNDSGVWMGKEMEQKRIIKLLEDNRYLCSTEKACWANLDSGCECPQLIASIRKEN